jgi:hypothetical protein
MALPDWAYGSFNGYVEGGGTVSMSVTALGKITGKVAANGKSYTFSAASYAAGGNETDGFTVTVDAKAGKEVVSLTLVVNKPSALAPDTLGVVNGQFGAGNIPITMYRDVWQENAPSLEPYIGYYTAILPLRPASADMGNGYLTITVNNKGKVTTTGKLADGTAVSLNSTLILDESGHVFAVVYTSPAAYKGGYLFGLAEFVKPEGGGHVFLRLLGGEPFIWENPNFINCELGIVGGWYDKTDNLYDYYQGKSLIAERDTASPDPELIVGGNKHASNYWDFSNIALTPVCNASGLMTGLSAPKANLPVKIGNNWDYSAENTVGLNIRLNRSTGIIKGSFKAWFDYGTTHTSKTISYEGVLTPEREDKTDGWEGRGFFLWSDPEPGNPKWSYPFYVSIE